MESCCVVVHCLFHLKWDSVLPELIKKSLNHVVFRKALVDRQENLSIHCRT